MADPDRVLLQPDVYEDWHEDPPEPPEPPVQQVQSVHKTGSTWPDRPTADPSVLVLWIGPDPSPPGATAPAVNGMYPGDLRITELSADEGTTAAVTSVDNRIGAVTLSDRYVGLVSGRAAAAQLPTDYTTFGRDRGSGTALPTTDRRRGDAYFHTGLTSLMVWTGTAWRQVDRAIAASDTARNAISTTYSAALHEGFEVWVTATDIVSVWTGTVWKADLTSWTTLPLVGGTVLAGTTFASSGGGNTPAISYRVEGNRGVMRGWGLVGTSGIAANAALLSTALPAAVRPVAPAGIYPWNDQTLTNTRMEINPNGQMYTPRAVTAGQYLGFDKVSWPLL